jgi:hypothetical protein
MSVESSTGLETPVVLTEQNIQPIVACMGSAACRRVCEFVDPNYQTSDTDPSYGLPLEQDCSVLDSITSQDQQVATELLAAVTIPELRSLKGDQIVKEASSYLEYLREEDSAFGDYMQSLLRGTNQPRFALTIAKQNYEASKVFDGEYAPTTDEDKEELLTFHGVLRGFHDLRNLETTGLLFDNSMQQMFEHASREIGVGHHIKLVGEPGIAKTTFAKYLAHQNAIAHNPNVPKNELLPTVISFSSTSEAESQMTEQTFAEGTLGSQLGKIGKAMKEGRGVVLDEQNGMTADQQTYFNDLFLKKPGQEVTINGETFKVANGFSVIATLNAMTDTQGNRRHGRQQQDSANAARFSRLDFKYPYQTGFNGNPDETVSRIFLAYYVDNFGWHMPDSSVINLLDSTKEIMAQITRMATEPSKDATTTSITANQARPDLAECISPRDLSRILELGFAYGENNVAVSNIRKLIFTRVQQILSSDNGHFVAQKAKDAVNQHLRNTNFNA